MTIKDDKYYRKELSEDIMKIMLSDRNKESYARFRETIKDLKPKKCIVKYGWASGEGIDFTLIYEKNGEGKPYDEFIKGIEDKSNVHYFIMGLAPENFYFNQESVVNKQNHLMLMLKLERDD